MFQDIVDHYDYIFEFSNAKRFVFYCIIKLGFSRFAVELGSLALPELLSYLFVHELI